uniref:Vitrin n=1 Tax=Ciona intestinalis TaxID=7719 RepID=F6SU54_CIOIN|nr:vitrin [Ciona intestinalis]|eukprot:XP_002127559.1 vitrin [Ciona intestinalis]
MAKLAVVCFLLICATGISAKRMRLLKCTRTLHSYPSMSKLHNTTVICPAQCPLDKCRVYGTDVYAAYSSICCAGIHAGAINNKVGGLMTVKINRYGGGNYAGSVKNGVTSRDLEKAHADFTVTGKGQTVSTTVNNEPELKSTTTTTQATTTTLTKTTTVLTTISTTTTTTPTTTTPSTTISTTTTTTTVPTSPHQPKTKNTKKSTVSIKQIVAIFLGILLSFILIVYCTVVQIYKRRRVLIKLKNSIGIRLRKRQNLKAIGPESAQTNLKSNFL